MTLLRIKNLLNSREQIGEAVKKTTDCITLFKEKLSNKEKNGIEAEVEEILSEEVKEDKSNKMLQVLDWAYTKANSDIPGLGTSSEMAKKYLDKEGGSVIKAVDSMVRWQITAAASTGFVSSLGGLATMPLTLPANIAGVMAIQLRMIGAIAELGGYHEESEEKKTGMYLCLLGSQAGNVLSKTTSQFTIKFTTAALKKLPGTVLTQINKAVGFRLFTKFGQTGLVNINRMIPILGGVIGASVDALSTYAIAKAAKALFLNEIIDFEKQELIEQEKVKILINMALVDGEYSESEAEFLYNLTNTLNISDKNRDGLYKMIQHPKTQNINYELFKEDIVLSMTMMSLLSKLIIQDGKTENSELVYLKMVGKGLGFTPEQIEDLCK
ncbi:EcsC protein family [uncultured Bacteroides sp.]|uniref:EcsC family protein n=1 Tax=Bacteroides TaxID=816 RepID=UPI0008216EA4|nr:MULTISPECIES: EcsC family protein [Bacteroides]MCR8892126.1 EcsC family protein [Bacteroides sp. ET336]MCU6772147.1 EcsC family protein [Bacteroides cellulolyticus]MDN0056623.1 EcsC family protein [Bacteroides caecigallinarum]SCI23220.1 EcsC protein family [uncultured Bacteroides sp.]